jgi:hypothetical protein
MQLYRRSPMFLFENEPSLWRLQSPSAALKSDALSAADAQAVPSGTGLTYSLLIQIYIKKKLTDYPVFKICLHLF